MRYRAAWRPKDSPLSADMSDTVWGTSFTRIPRSRNYGTAGRGVRLCTGMTLAIEPMVNMGRPDVREMSDGWTVKTADGTLSAHYENSVALTEDGPVILTVV